MILSDKIKAAIRQLSDLPGLGPRQATRLVFHLIHTGSRNISDLTLALDNLKSIKSCSDCFFINETGGPLCHICSDPARDPSRIMLVEKDTDLISLEATRKWPGRYFIIGDLRKNGVLDSEQQGRLSSFKVWLNRELPEGKAQEIVLAVNPTTFGDLSAAMLSRELSDFTLSLTRLGRGLPTGGEIEFADAATLSAALDNRK